jgi:hypothetical protein
MYKLLLVEAPGTRLGSKLHNAAGGETTDYARACRRVFPMRDPRPQTVFCLRGVDNITEVVRSPNGAIRSRNFSNSLLSETATLKTKQSPPVARWHSNTSGRAQSARVAFSRL